MNEIIFVVEDSPEGGYVAKAAGESIFTEADTLDVRPVHAVIDGVIVVEPGGELSERLQFAPGSACGGEFAPAVGKHFGHRSPEQDLLELSDADLQIGGETWQKFGRMDQWELREYTRDHCPEWKDPEGSMIPMQPEELFEALKFTPAQREAAMAKLRAEDEINAAFEAAPH